MARLPLDPRLACMLLEARQRECLDEVAIIAAALSIQDPRERPALRQAEADEAQTPFRSAISDFIALLNIWHSFQKTVRRRRSWNEVKKFCHNHFLSFRRMREWQDVYRQIMRILADHAIRPAQPSRSPAEVDDLGNSRYAAIHQSILCGFLSNIAMKKENQIFHASHNRQVMIFPGSGLFKNPGQWVVSAEMVETSRLFARCVAMIDPSWIEPVAKEQCKYTYIDPHWERRRGQVVATEQVSLYGLIIDRRPRPFGPVDPATATDIFIRRALIEGDVQKPLPFMAYNFEILSNIVEMENRLRRKDIRLDDEALFAFYSGRLGALYDLRSLKQRIKSEGGDHFLRLTEEDLIVQRPSDEELAKFPDHLSVGRHRIDFEYNYSPGRPNDGITAKVPLPVAEDINAHKFQWLVPGLLDEKITALVKGLPKELRKRLVPISETVATITAQIPAQKQDSLPNTLSSIIRQRFGVRIPPAAWDESLLPDHLRMRIALTDPSGKVIKSGRSTEVLNIGDIGYPISSDFEIEKQNWERCPIENWDFGDLPDAVTLNSLGGRGWTAYPALENRKETIALTVFIDPKQAGDVHRRGVKALLVKRFSRDIAFLRKNLRLVPSCEAAGRYFGGCKALEEQIASQVIDDLMLKDIRSAEGFQAHIQKLERDGIAGRGQAKLKRVTDVLAVYAALRLQLHNQENTHSEKKPVAAFLNELRDNLNALVPKSFVRLYDNHRLERLVRYIQAISLRAERGLINLEKDRTKSFEVKTFSDRLNGIIRSLTPQASPEKRQAVEAFFWMLEEFKISVFAQEIKTAHPVSAKKLKIQINKIEAML